MGVVKTATVGTMFAGFARQVGLWPGFYEPMGIWPPHDQQIWHDQHGIPWVQGKMCLKPWPKPVNFSMCQMRPGLLLRWGWIFIQPGFPASGQLFNHGRVSVEPWVGTWQGTGFKQAPRRLDLGYLGIGERSGCQPDCPIVHIEMIGTESNLRTTIIELDDGKILTGKPYIWW